MQQSSLMKSCRIVHNALIGRLTVGSLIQNVAWVLKEFVHLLFFLGVEVEAASIMWLHLRLL